MAKYIGFGLGAGLAAGTVVGLFVENTEDGIHRQELNHAQACLARVEAGDGVVTTKNMADKVLVNCGVVLINTGPTADSAVKSVAVELPTETEVRDRVVAAEDGLSSIDSASSAMAGFITLMGAGMGLIYGLQRPEPR